MGFNNDGAEAVARRLAARSARSVRRRPGRGGVVVGVNIGKTKAVPDEHAVADYEKSTRLLAPHADYLVVNVSSPNTPGLRDLQSTSRLRPLLTAVRRQAEAVRPGHLPLLVKIAPDLADGDVLEVADLALELGLDGIVATNTTTARDGLSSPAEAVARAGAGGLSGPPVRARAVEVLRLLRGRVGPDLTLIGVGGISDADDARERLDAGATLVQAYTAFIYEGALWPRRVQRELAREGARA
jgi:dihydroorotate dehydrogenase